MITLGLGIYAALAVTVIMGLGKAASRPLPKFKSSQSQDSFRTDTAQAL